MVASRSSRTATPADRSTRRYGDDLAHVHDAGFGALARGAAPGLLRLLRGNGIRDGLVVDLACGSGIWARALVEAGYDVLGIDLSPAMIRLARRQAPGAAFRVGSLHRAPLPRCAAATCLGEGIGYLFDRGRGRDPLRALFTRVHAALAPGGLFIFDLIEPAAGGVSAAIRGWREGEGWAVLYESEEDARGRLLTRRITTFRRAGRSYRRVDEIHRLRLLPRGVVLRALRAAGFRARAVHRYGSHRLAPRRVGFIARKP
jgi:SAM-dependent methyltransferase